MMKVNTLIRLLVCCIIFSVSFHVFAQGTSPAYDTPEINDWQTTWMTSCASHSGYSCYVDVIGTVAAGDSMLCGGSNQSGPGRCIYIRANRQGTTAIVYQSGWFAPGCTAPATLSAGLCVCPAGQTCEGSGPPPPAGCSNGVTKTFNVTTGWGWITGQTVLNGQTFANIACAPGKCPNGPDTPPPFICDGSCQWIQSGPVVGAYVAKESSSSGMNRVSVDQGYMSTANECVGMTDAVNPNLLSPPCPGQYGTLNGKPTCLATGPSGDGLAGKTVASGSGTGTQTAVTSPDGTPAKVGADGSIGTPSNPNPGSTSTTPTPTLPGGTSSSPDGSGTVKFGTIYNPATPGVPATLWARKYADSPVDHFKAGLDAATLPAKRVIAVFAPTWTDNEAACPQFTLTLDLGSHWHFGTFAPNIPCSVWAFCRVVLIITALFLARSLIFGG